MDLAFECQHLHQLKQKKLGDMYNILYLWSMNWNYISGFFDADGSISYVRPGVGKRKTIQISFHNNEKVILDDIRSFIESELGCKGGLSLKRARKDTHQDSYDLKYYYQSAYSLCRILDPLHPKKKHRCNIGSQIGFATKRNGKYTDEELKIREQLEEQWI